MQKSRRTNNVIWFGRWSRSPWAMFRSLNVIVHILPLNLSICDKSLLKQKQNILKNTCLGIFLSKETFSALIYDGDLAEEEFLTELVSSTNYYDYSAPDNDSGELFMSNILPGVLFCATGRIYFI